MKLFRLNPETDLDLFVDNLWDGCREGYQHQVVIRIRRGRIAAVQPENGGETSPGVHQLHLTGLTLMPGLIDAHEEAYTTSEIDIIRRTCEGQMRMLAGAHRLGVQLVVGTDAGAPGVYHGASYVDELEYWRRAGLPAPAIFRAATVTAAAALGLGRELGQVRPGYRPCLVAVRGDPLADFQVLRRPEAVFIDSP